MSFGRARHKSTDEGGGERRWTEARWVDQPCVMLYLGRNPVAPVVDVRKERGRGTWRARWRSRKYRNMLGIHTDMVPIFRVSDMVSELS